MRKLIGILACVAVTAIVLTGCADETTTVTTTEQVYESPPPPPPPPPPAPVRETVYESEPQMVSPGQEIVE